MRYVTVDVRFRTSRPDAAASITIPLNLNEPSLQITGTGDVALQANVNVHYSSAGGSANSSMVLSKSTQATLDVSMTDANGQGSCTLQTASLPPPVTSGGSFTLTSATYPGDGNYLSAISSGAPLPVIGVSVNYPAGITAIPTGGNSTLVLDAASVITGLASPVPPNLTWTSSDPAVASVSAGNVTGIAAGISTITVMDPASGASASILALVANRDLQQ